MPKDGRLAIKLTDMNGKVLRRENQQVPKGFSTHSITGMEKFTAGLYFLVIEFEGKVFTYKLTK